MAIGAYCRCDVVTIDQNETAHAAAGAMREHGVGCLIVTGGGRPWGVLTDRDLALRVIRRGLDPKQTLVSTLTERDFVSIREDRPVRVATRLMERFGVRRLPVLNARNQLVGIVSWDDLLGLLARELSDAADAAASQSPRLPVPPSRALTEITELGAEQ